MIQFLDPVDDIRKAKIREFFEKAEVKAKQRTAPPPKPAGPGAKRPGAPNGKVGGGVAKVAGGASGIARTGSLKRPGSVASSVDREPDSPKKPTIVRPGMRPPTTTSSSASSSTGTAPPSRFGPRQSVVPSARAGSPVQPPAPKKAPSDDPPKLSRGLMGRVLPPFQCGVLIG
jgi:cytoskeleton-associated protein 5